MLLAAITALAGAACTAPASGPVASQRRPDLAPAPVKVLTHSSGNGNGDIFLTPQGGGYPSGPEIITPAGRVVWFHRLPAGQRATDFRTQTYRGQPVLTWCQGQGLGTSGFTDYILNDRYQRIATVQAGNGLLTDYHEFLITPWNTALITAFTMNTANLTSIGGSAHQSVVDDSVQEIDIRSGKVLFEWNSVDHVPYTDSMEPVPASATTPWDWFHINAVHLDTDGNLLINSRFTWTTYKVSLHTGKVIWELGGKQSSFRLRAAPGQVLDRAGEIFAFQHDPEALGHDEYSFFDDEADPIVKLLPYSRVVVVKLDPAARLATLVKSYDQPEQLSAKAQGNAQTTANGDLFVSWGLLPYISEFSRSGRLVFNAQFPRGVSTYRAYRLPWKG